MKVKNLIKWLKKQNPEDIVGIFDVGCDSGDWNDLVELDKEKDGWMYHKDFNFDKNLSCSLRVCSFKELIEIKKKEGADKEEIEELKKDYGGKENERRF